MSLRLLGVDFTSAPRRAKPISVARARLQKVGERDCVLVDTVDTLADFTAFERLLEEPGPWVGGFDFPFGLPREAVEALGWPCDWRALAAYCGGLARADLRAALDAYRQSRPWGRRYAHRAGDRAAGSHSPLKLVNPPVALMFAEGASRLARAGLRVPGLADGDAQRVAVEAYPGFVARSITRSSYKSDTRAKQTPARAQARIAILGALVRGEHPLGLALQLPDAVRAAVLADGSGDPLDAVICALQAGWAAVRAGEGFGLPAGIDPVEGWIVGVPPADEACGRRDAGVPDRAQGRAP